MTATADQPGSPAPSLQDTAASPPDPTLSDGIDALLAAAVQETARLLAADGAMVYLLDPAGSTLRLSHDAGIDDERARAWVRGIALEPGQGLFGTAVATRAVVHTEDYLHDRSFEHAEDPDRVVADIGIRSMVVAPMVSGDEVFGALGAFATRPDAFDAPRIALVRSLADHAAVAIANRRLIAELDRSRAELAERAEIERTLREITMRISAAADLAEVLQRAVDEAARLLDADGARIDLIDRGSGLLRWAYASGDLRPGDDVWPTDPDETLEQGVSGQAIVTGRPFWTGDYANDDRFPHGRAATRYVEHQGIRSVMAVPLIGDAGPFGTLTAFADRPDAWDDRVAPLLEAIGAQAAIAIGRAMLIDELDEAREAQARRAEGERALREVAARITGMRDPTDILQQVIELAGRLVRGDGAILDLIDPATGDLRWALDDGLGRRFTDEERAQLWISIGVGATGQAVAERRTIVASDDLVSLFPPSPESTAFYERTGFRSMIAAPIIGEGGPVGVIEVYAVRPQAFSASDAALIEALADHAALAIANADLLARLTHEEARFRGLVETTPDVIWRADRDGRFTFMADSGSALFGRPVAELLGRHFELLTDPASMPVAIEHYRRAGAEPGRIQRVSLTLVRADGTRFAAEVVVAGVFEDGQWVGNQGTVRDVSEQVRLERELRRQAVELAAGEERAHLARELHDSVTQALFSMTLVTRSIEVVIATDPEAALAHVAQLRDLQREALAEMRALIFELRPGNLEQDGLVRALKTHAAALQGRVGLAIRVESDIDGRIPLEAEQALYRVAQEALHNVVKHAAAREVRIDLERDHGGVRMRVIDDGKGFDPATVDDGRLGLAGMRARADRLGATFDCTSTPGGGTTIEVRLPADALASIADRARLVDDAARARLDPAGSGTAIRDD